MSYKQYQATHLSTHGEWDKTDKSKLPWKCLIDITFHTKPKGKGRKGKDKGTWSFRKNQDIIGEWPLQWRKQYIKEYESTNTEAVTPISAPPALDYCPVDSAPNQDLTTTLNSHLEAIEKAQRLSLLSHVCSHTIKRHSLWTPHTTRHRYSLLFSR